MDFDTAKENIQPLRQGRRPDVLELALSEQSKDSLEVEKRQRFEAIVKYVGEDPLSAYYDYICWIEQSYPKGGSESGLDKAVLDCICAFDSDEFPQYAKYRQDRRMIKLYIKYIDTIEHPHDRYKLLYEKGIGTLVADLYIAWSYYYDALNNYKEVEAIFLKGFDAGAQPMEDLTQAREAFRHSMLQRERDEASKQNFQEQMEERRSALTSLRAYKHKYVGSLRTGFAVRHENPGIVLQEPLKVAKSSVQVHEVHDEQGATALPQNVSVIRSIIDSTKKKENVHEPGPWSKGNASNKGGLFGKSGASSHLDFAIMEDDDLPPIPCPVKLFELGIRLPPGFVRSNKPQKPWNIPIVIEEPLVPKAVPMYEKFLLYPNAQTDISPDEYRAYKWFKDREMKGLLTEQYDHVWENKFETEIRIPPGFHKRNVKQDEKESFEKFISTEEIDAFQMPFDKIYPENGDEISPEELLADKFKRGLIKVLTEDDFECIDDDDGMELTMIGDRHQSIYQMSRLSIVPRKSVMRKSFMPPPTVEEEDEEPQKDEMKPKASEIWKERQSGSSNIKRKFEETEEGKAIDDKLVPALKKGFVASTPPHSSFNTNSFFKQPAPVDKNPVRFSLMDDDDTCSTHQFNFFIKEQSVSTPVQKKTLQRVTPLATENPAQVEEIAAEKPTPAKEIEVKSEGSLGNQSAPAISPETCIEKFVPKQLSTIMETTESTQSNKSSVSVSNETDFNSKTPKIFGDCEEPIVAIKETEQQWFNPLVASFRMPEEQTVTCPKMMAPAVRVADTYSSLVTPLKVRLEPPLLEIGQIDLLTPESNFSENSVKSSEQEITIIEVPESEPERNASSSSEASTKQEEDSILDIPVTQEFEIRSPQAFEAASTQFVEVPASQDFAAQQEEASILEIPATQELTISATQGFEVPPTQDVGPVPIQDFEFPATQDDVPNTKDFEIPATQEEPDAKVTIKAAETATEKNDQVLFNIYEDSIKEVPLVQMPVNPIPCEDDDETRIFHMSRKENLVSQPPKAVMRTVSDEFLDLLVSPQPKHRHISAANASSKSERQGEVSDLLKFSGAALLENSLKNLSIKAPKCATPAETDRILFDEDLNTEKFSMALSNNKNSTLLLDVHKKSLATVENEMLLDLSIAIEEDEMSRLGLQCKVPEVAEDVKDVDFKVPQLPVLKPSAAKPAAFKVFEDSNENEDLGKSIYFPKEIQEDHDDDEDEVNCSFIPSVDNRYEHAVENDRNLSLNVQEAIQISDGNPFDIRVHEALLERVGFTHYLESNVSNCMFLKKIPKLTQGLTVKCHDNEFTVLKFITKGAFGSIYTATNSKDGKVYALKQEKPPNLWEYYILVELMCRLKNEQMIPAFMTINHAVIAHNYSIFVTQFSPYGSIIEVCNKHKKATNKHVDEYVVMVLTTQLLSIVDHLHGCRIIHADLKPDNFLLVSTVEFGMKVPAIQLIDFGSAIDMDWYNNGETFNFVVSTENFVCCEMLENKPWTYQTDLFGLAGTVHVMLFGRYMEVEKKALTWNIRSRFPRYFNKLIWEEFFHTLLNVRSGGAMPNLQALKDRIEENVQSKQRFVCEKIADFNKTLSN